MKKVFRSTLSKAGTLVLAATLVFGSCPIGAHAYETDFKVESTAAKSAADTPDPTWSTSNVTAPESAGFTNASASTTLKKFKKKTLPHLRQIQRNYLGWMNFW